MRLAKTKLTKTGGIFNLPTSGNNVNPNFTSSSCNFACTEQGGVKVGGAAVRPTAEVCLHSLFAVTLCALWKHWRVYRARVHLYAWLQRRQHLRDGEAKIKQLIEWQWLNAWVQWGVFFVFHFTASVHTCLLHLALGAMEQWGVDFIRDRLWDAKMKNTPRSQLHEQLWYSLSEGEVQV